MKIIFPLISLVLLLSTPNSVFALKSDRDQPAEIEADNTEIDFKSGVHTLTDNVLFVQGTLRLKADKLVAVRNKKGDLEKATAWGSLARVKLRPDNEPHDVEGWGKKMVVDNAKNTVTLIGNASLKQGDRTARGDTIVYNLSTDKLRIIGNSKAKAGSLSKVSEEKEEKSPVRTIVDTFSDDNQGPSSTVSSNVERTQQLNNGDVSLNSGKRSRLIIRPDALKK